MRLPLLIAASALLLTGAGCFSPRVVAPTPLPPSPEPTAPAPVITEPEIAQPTHPNVTVLEPLTGTTITSPVTISGQAKLWYFEGSFPVEIQNASGQVIALGPATAQGDWMTANFVPFQAVLSFPVQPAGSIGSIVLRKDDPSGEHPDSLTIPIRF